VDHRFDLGDVKMLTFAGAGVAFLGSSPANVRWYLERAGARSIGPDKINQLRHALFLKDAEGVRAHMRGHRELLQPKFEAVERILSKQLAGTGLATWSTPKGGYFVRLDVLDG
jgi:DNA-binding transcriptional MocR family regulator